MRPPPALDCAHAIEYALVDDTGVAAGYASIAEAKARAERSYQGLSRKWKATGHPEEEARKYIAERFRDQACSFCGRVPPQYRALVGGKARICNHCIEQFHDAIHGK